MRLSLFLTHFILLLIFTWIAFILTALGWHIIMSLFLTSTICGVILLYVLIRFTKTTDKSSYRVNPSKLRFVLIYIILILCILFNVGDNGDSPGSYNFMQLLFNMNSEVPLFGLSFPLFIIYYILLVGYFNETWNTKYTLAISTNNSKHPVIQFMLLSILLLFATVGCYFALGYALNDKNAIISDYPNYYYLGVRDKEVYYKDGSTYTIVPNADSNTLKVYDESSRIILDASRVYYAGQELVGIPPSEFKVVGQLVVGKNKIYDVYDSVAPVQVENYDYDSFSYFAKSSSKSIIMRENYYFDKNGAYFLIGEKDLFNPDNENLAFHSLVRMPGVDTKTFKYDFGRFSSDINSVYCGPNKLTPFDMKKFKNYNDDYIIIDVIDRSAVLQEKHYLQPVFDKLNSIPDPIYMDVIGNVIGDGTNFYVDYKDCQKLSSTAIIVPKNEFATKFELLYTEPGIYRLK